MDAARLTMACEHVGCAAKVSPEVLEQVVNFWQVMNDNKVGIGLTEKDDVATYDLGGEFLLLHSIDVITPIVDNAFNFGAIAVSHALSDIYAKGGMPISALSFLGIPQSAAFPVQEIIAGCSSKLCEAKVTLLGGHTISSVDPLVGFAVTGIVKKNSFVPQSGACVGDKLVLTKSIGSGIISTALKFSHLGIENTEITAKELATATASMEFLNEYASQTMLQHQATACTDVTGFGLIGHISQLARSSKVGAHISCHLVPKLPGISRLFQNGIAPSRLDENLRYYYGNRATKTKDVNTNWPILFCPETSGGLLITVDAKQAHVLINSLNNSGNIEAAIIGEITNDPSCTVVIDY